VAGIQEPLDLQPWLGRSVQAHQRWMDLFGPFQAHPSTLVSQEELSAAFDRLQQRLTDNYPFGHPRYLGQMLKPPHPVAILGYLSAMLINPNNHALDGGPATAAMEKEVIARLAGLFRLPQHLGHLTSSGTIANLEALWVARECNPGTAIAFSADAHYTHRRMCQVLAVEPIPISVDAQGCLDLDDLERALQAGGIGTVVATLGTTGLGALDPLPGIVERAHAYGARVHVDAAYGGFFALIADDSRDGVASGPFNGLGTADSIVVDPHKHGLQPYGCGAVLFADPQVGAYYLHDSPYTYFSSDELHLGEISLECSRAGAAAAALWLTLEVIGLDADGLGRILRGCRAAALDFTTLLEQSGLLAPFQEPALDIVTYYPRRSRMSEIDGASQHLFRSAASLPADQQVHLATYAVSNQAMSLRHPEIECDVASARILRSTVMKPESAQVIDSVVALLHDLLDDADPAAPGITWAG